MENQKHLFNLPPDMHYLNCAFKGPLLKAAEKAAIEALARERNPATLEPADFFTGPEEARELFAKIINCSPWQVAVIPSASYGMATVMKNIEGRKGQHAITIESEFPSGYLSLMRWCDANGCELKVIRPDHSLQQRGEDWNGKILDSINEHTAVVVISSVHWTDGLKFDLESIGKQCKKVGAKFIVDGTQSVGALPMDVEKYHIDALICAAYKWLLGPYSIGLAYYGPAFDNGIPLEETWMNRTNAQNFSNLTDYDPHYKPGAGRYNVGETSNMVLMPMLIEGLKQVHEWSAESIQAYSRELTQPLWDYLGTYLGVIREPDPYFSNHLFGLKLSSGFNTGKLQQNLENRKIYISMRSGSIRVSVSLFNTKDDILQLIEAIRECKA